MTGGTQSFKAVVGKAPGGALLIPVPFDPDTIWGRKPRHLVKGRVGSCGVRGAIEKKADGFALKLGAAWARDNPVAPGTTVEVSLAAEGPAARCARSRYRRRARERRKGRGVLRRPRDLLSQSIPDLDRRHEESSGRAGAPHRRSGEIAQGRREAAAALRRLIEGIIASRDRLAESERNKAAEPPKQGENQ